MILNTIIEKDESGYFAERRNETAISLEDVLKELMTGLCRVGKRLYRVHRAEFA
jgi:hypothetical protein